MIDHHAHPLLGPEHSADRAGFLRWFTESVDPLVRDRHVPNTLLVRSVVRSLAAELGCAPTLDDVVAARAEVPYDVWCRRLLGPDGAHVSTICCDGGYGGPDALDDAAMAALTGCTVVAVERVESIAERLVAGHRSFDAFAEAFRAEVDGARARGVVAFKSVVAYRSGLGVAPSDRAAATVAYDGWRSTLDGRPPRLEAKPLCDWVVGATLDAARAQGLPVQLHTGFGDRDADLRAANPLHLRDVIETSGVDLVLLHAGWPYFRELAHLASIYGNVWMDLSLAVPFATTDVVGMLSAVLGVAPWSKVLLATDGAGVPERWWAAARWGRWGLGRVLGGLVADDVLGPDEAWELASAVLAGNAARLYGLPRHPAA